MTMKSKIAFLTTS